MAGDGRGYGPLYFRTKQDYGVREAVSGGLSEAEHGLQAVRQTLSFEIKDLFLMAQTSAKLIELIGTGTLPQTRLTLESALASYAVGKVDFLTLLTNLLNVLNQELQYAQELTNFEKPLRTWSGWSASLSEWPSMHRENTLKRRVEKVVDRKPDSTARDPREQIMRSKRRCVVVSMAVSVITFVTLLTLAQAGERTSIAGPSDPPRAGHDPAAHGRPGPGRNDHKRLDRVTTLPVKK